MIRRPLPFPAVAKPQQIAKVLEDEIISGRLSYGDRLQSENELVRRFSVSRSTIRKGLSALSDRGLISTRMGIGSFVTFDGKVMDDTAGWTRALANAGAQVETRTLRLEIVDDPALAEEIGLAETAFVALDRVRSDAADGHAISIERSRLPLTAELEELPLRGLREGSLHKTLREIGLMPHHGEEWIDVVPLDADDAGILRCPPGTMFLRTRRVFRTADGQVMEHVTSLLNPSHFALHREV